MSNYRRYFVPGGTYFFTLVSCNRAPIFGTQTGRSILGDVFRECLRDWPFTMNAVVLLPDHLHTLWTLPPGDARYPARWSRIKKEFTTRWLIAGGKEQPITPAMQAENRRGVWQNHYWEHTIRDEDDFDSHFDYVHYNPVKHGYVPCPHQWEWSTFHRWVERGVYARDWACVDGSPPPNFTKIEDSTGEPT